MVRRCLIGVRAMSDAPIRYLPDASRLVEAALDELGFDAEPLEIVPTRGALDTTRAACALRGATVVITLGGDGTNRAFAKGWLDAPLVPLSTGTNNAFPPVPPPACWHPVTCPLRPWPGVPRSSMWKSKTNPETSP